MKLDNHRHVMVGLVLVGLLGFAVLAFPAISLAAENVERPSVSVTQEIVAPESGTVTEAGPPAELTAEHETPMTTPEVRKGDVDSVTMTRQAPDLAEIIAEQDERSALSF